MTNLSTYLLSTFIWATACALPVLAEQQAELPIVDLGYAVHQPTFIENGNYYNFSNIRYAEPPLGNLRFAASVPPKGRNRTVDNGSIARICPQAYPAGSVINQVFNSYYSTTGQTGLDGFGNATQGFDYPRNQPKDPRATEDCLFLDLMVPKTVFEKHASKESRPGKGAAVMVWIYGGGYCAGTKYDTPSGGLVSRSQENGKDGVIYMAFNYRLGAFGWLSGPSFAVNGTPNAGFYDQRLALEWIQRNIHRFGGDPKKVTVFGESAGGGSIAHHLTAYGGEKGKAPFQRAILESPGFIPTSGNYEQELNFQTFLELLNVTTLDEARQLPSSVVQNVSEYQVRNSKAGSWTYGPAVDGDFVPQTPSLLLMQGRFDPSVKIMIGHNGDEGLGYPMLQNNTAFEEYVASTFPNAPLSVRNYITEKLYPPILETQGQVLEDYDPLTTKSIAVTGYNNTLGRQTLFTSDTVINCLTYDVKKAFKGQAYSYMFKAPPALHGQELYYVFYNQQETDVFYRPINVTLAHIIQDYWLNFAQTGNPNGKGLPRFDRSGNNANVQELSLANVGPTDDITDNERCRFWQLGLYT